jgi:hypothetical protein
MRGTSVLPVPSTIPVTVYKPSLLPFTPCTVPLKFAGTILVLVGIILASLLLVQSYSNVFVKNVVTESLEKLRDNL